MCRHISFAMTTTITFLKQPKPKRWPHFPEAKSPPCLVSLGRLSEDEDEHDKSGVCNDMLCTFFVEKTNANPAYIIRIVYFV